MTKRGYPVSSRALEKILEIIAQPRKVRVELVNPNYDGLAKQVHLTHIAQDSDKAIVYRTWLTKDALLDHYTEQERGRLNPRDYLIKSIEWEKPCRIVLTPNRICIEHPSAESEAIKSLYAIVNRYKIPRKVLYPPPRLEEVH